MAAQLSVIRKENSEQIVKRDLEVAARFCDKTPAAENSLLTSTLLGGITIKHLKMF